MTFEMQTNRYSNLLEAVQALKERGFQTEFQFRDGKLQDLDSKRTYRENEMVILEYHRFEGQSNPSDMSIVVALETRNGKRGVVISSYGPYADPEMTDFLKEVPVRK